MDKKEILKTLNKNRDILKKRFSVSKIALFGSYAKNQQNPQSDIDFYVEFENKNFNNLTGLLIYLEELFQKKIDIVYNHKNANSIILNQIKNEALYG